MIYLNNNQKIYIALTVAGIVVVLLLTAFFFYKKVFAKRHFREATYLRLANLCNKNDYLLLNHFAIDFDDTHIGVIDHIVISKKYIFIINDFALSGVVSGDAQERFLRLIRKKDKVENVSNPLNYNINLIKRLNTFNHLDKSFVKGIVAINNDSKVNVSNMMDQFVIMPRKKIAAFIKKCDRDPVNNLKEEQVINFINKLDQQNRKRQ